MLSFSRPTILTTISRLYIIEKLTPMLSLHDNLACLFLQAEP